MKTLYIIKEGRALRIEEIAPPIETEGAFVMQDGFIPAQEVYSGPETLDALSYNWLIWHFFGIFPEGPLKARWLMKLTNLNYEIKQLPKGDEERMKKIAEFEKLAKECHLWREDPKKEDWKP
jgi:hypothetical protein